MYDVKSYYNAAKNAVLNIPEMEAKVREATNEDPWCVCATPRGQSSQADVMVQGRVVDSDAGDCCGNEQLVSWKFRSFS